MKKVYLLITLLSSLSCFGQIDVDSLVHEVKTNRVYIITDTINYLTGLFVRYEDNEKLNSYDLFLDSIGNIDEHLRVAIVHKEYDNNNRLIKRVGYGLNGYFNLWDYPPIETKNYYSDSTITDIFNHNYELRKRTIVIKDSRNRENKILEYDETLRLKKITTFEFNDNKGTLTISTFNDKNQHIENKLGVAKTFIRFDRDSEGVILEQIFYNSENEKVDANHLHSLRFKSNVMDNINCVFSYLLREEDKESKGHITKYFDSKGELKCISHWGEVITFKN